MSGWNTTRIQTDARALAGTTGMFVEDVHAALTVLSVPLGQINERVISRTGALTASAAWGMLSLTGFYGALLLDTTGGFLLLDDTGGYLLLG